MKQYVASCLGRGIGFSTLIVIIIIIIIGMDFSHTCCMGALGEEKRKKTGLL